LGNWAVAFFCEKGSRDEVALEVKCSVEELIVIDLVVDKNASVVVECSVDELIGLDFVVDVNGIIVVDSINVFGIIESNDIDEFIVLGFAVDLIYFTDAFGVIDSLLDFM
jgi:hypothetical protein